MMQHHLEADSFIIDFVYLNFTSLNNVLMCILFFSVTKNAAESCPKNVFSQSHSRRAMHSCSGFESLMNVKETVSYAAFMFLNSDTNPVFSSEVFSVL